MTREELAQDLAYARTLAEEGRHTPLIGGSFLVLFGVTLMIAYAVHWALLAGLFGQVEASWTGAIWATFGVCVGVGSFLVMARVRTLPGALSIANRVDRAVWQAVAIAIGAVIVGSIGRSIVFADNSAPNAIMGAGFGLYGVALSATAVIAEQKWLRPFALLAFLASFVLWFFLNEVWTYLAASIASFVVLLAPGIIMMRQEPSTIV